MDTNQINQQTQPLISPSNDQSACTNHQGLAAYADHARILGQEDPAVYAFVHEAMAVRDNYCASGSRLHLSFCSSPPPFFSLNTKTITQ